MPRIMNLKLTESEAQAVQVALVCYIHSETDSNFDSRLKNFASRVAMRLLKLRDESE